MMGHGKHARGGSSRTRGSTRFALPVALGAVILLGGGAFAAYRYDASATDRLLPGVRVAGVDVGEMTRQEALTAVEATVGERLDRRIEVRAGDESWEVSPSELGATADAQAVVDAALAVNDDYSWPSRVFHRLLNRSVHRSYDVDLTLDPARVGTFLHRVGRKVFVPPTNAGVDFRNGRIVVIKGTEGQALQAGGAKQALLEALRTTTDASVDLPIRTVEPSKKRKDLGHTIIVRLDQLKLFLYQGTKLQKTYPIAAGQPAYPTPTGDFKVVDKVTNPSWTNPDPTGWGADMPRYIPPGPGNPLGLYALYLNAAGIRIHGTPSTGSIGTYASHGCMRMYPWDVEELFGLVEIGTPVKIVGQ